MYAIVQEGSKQYRVEKGRTFRFDLKGARKEGETVEFADVLVIGNGEKVTIGAPKVHGAKVVGEIVQHIKGTKLRVFKYRRREGYHRTVGHRQKYTLVTITDIVTG